VLVALTIMLLALVAIGRLVDMGTDNANQARMTARGNRLAQSKMAEVESGAISVQSGQQTGDFSPEEPAWSWSVEPQQTGPPNLYLVTVRVSRTYNGGQTFEVTLTQYLMDPAAMGTAAQAEKPATDTSTTPTSTTPTSTGSTSTGGTSP
jgi:hypothetical protein